MVPVVDMILAPGDESTQYRGKIFMVFPFADHDLAGLLENPQVNWDHKLIKLYAMQLLRGTAYLHAVRTTLAPPSATPRADSSSS